MLQEYNLIMKHIKSNDKTEAKLSVNWSNNTLDDYNFPTKGNSNHLKMSVALGLHQYAYLL
jgi:outer membrane protein insertion porin family